MNIRLLALCTITVLVIVISACAPVAATETMPVESNYGLAGAPTVEMPLNVPQAAPDAAKSGLAAPPVIESAGSGGAAAPQTGFTIDPAAVTYRTDRMIIKNGDIRLLVDDPDVAIDRVTQVITDLGGYTISSRVWYQDSYGTLYKYASITMGVPVENFEPALRRLRQIALRVLDENASGEDVTDQFVDLESELVNLRATEARVRTFLEQAKTVEEALRVNAELSKIQAQIEEVQGRINYLKDRSSFSTITVNIEPEIPTPTPAPTPTVTPTRTPEPTPTATPWAIRQTVEDAGQSLVRSYQGLTEFLVWLVIAILPVMLPFLLILWLLWKLFGLKRKPTVEPPAPPKAE